MLEINISLIILTAVLFFALVALVNSWLYRPLLGFMSEREESIKKDLENAKQNSNGSVELYKEAEEFISKAKAEAATIKSKIVSETKEYANRKIEKKKDELLKDYEKFKTELKSRENEIKSTLLSQAPLFKEALKAKFSKLQ